jgi:hypothetical protein
MNVLPGIVRFKNLSFDLLLMRAGLVQPIFPRGRGTLKEVYR